MTIYEQLRRDEGVRLKPYTDLTGHLTIGVGRNLSVKGISADEARLLLENDVAETAGSLARFHWYTGLDSVRQGAVLNMAFNMGVAGVLGFHQMIAALERHDWDLAAMEMLDSDWAQQVGARATRLANQMRDGVWI